jgi:hypothetical protein
MGYAPWIAFASIFSFVLCCVALAAILLESDGEEVTAWPDLLGLSLYPSSCRL